MVMSSDAMQIRDAGPSRVGDASAKNVPLGYKRTEVGVIPDDWQAEQIGLLFDAKAGSDVDAARSAPVQGELYRYPIFANGLTNRGLYGYCSYADSPAGSITVTARGSLGTAIYRDEPFVAIGRLLVLTPKVAMDARFFSESINFGVDFAIESTGVPQLTAPQVARYFVPIPSPAEQRAIAEALADVDGLREALDALIAKKRAIKQAAMQQLLTGKTRLPGFSDEWGEFRLRKFVRDFIVPMRDKPKRFAGDVPWCRIEDFDGIYLSESKSGRTVDSETIGEMNLKVYPVGTLLVSCSADLGHCAIVARPLVSNQTFIGLLFDEKAASSLFFYYYMSFCANELNVSSSGTTISYLSREQFEEFPVVIPPDQEERVAIATVLSDMDAEIAALETRRDKTRAIKQGMMQQLLTGRVRLVKPEAAA